MGKLYFFNVMMTIIFLSKYDKKSECNIGKTICVAFALHLRCICVGIKTQRAYSTRRCFGFTLTIKPNASEMYM